MRVIAGHLKGRALKGPASQSIRPTSDRLREAIFNVLSHAYDDICKGARVIDLCAGTGALAIEALSRGAQFALLVDEGAEARGLIRSNIEALGLGGSTRLLRRNATSLGQAPHGERFNLAFLDPPYRHGLNPHILNALHKGQWLSPQALCVIEDAADSELHLPAAFSESERRVYGDTQCVFALYSGAAEQTLEIG
jgi:16S rRNA (guanine966-N2)-methyltransferase